MLLVIASVEQCHGICHRNIALKSINKASFLTCWGKKRVRHKYFIFRIAYVQSRQFFRRAVFRQLRLSVLCRAAAALLPQFSLCPELSTHSQHREDSPLRKRRQNASLLPAHGLQNAHIQNWVGSVHVTSFITRSTNISFGRTQKKKKSCHLSIFLLALRYLHTAGDTLREWSEQLGHY